MRLVRVDVGVREGLASFLATALVGFLLVCLFSLLGWLGCTGPTRTVQIDMPRPERPWCIVVLQPPPVAPPIFREMMNHCRDREGRRLAGEEWCLTTDEANELTRFAAQSTTWALTAWHSCSTSEPGVEPGVRVQP